MKELKFRAWHLIDKKMYQWGEIFDLPAWEIFPGTPEQRPFEVMQYTGKKATDGTEIYEGDILKVVQRNLNNAFGGIGDPYETKIERVRWIEASASFYVPGGFVKSIEVIGNICEHPHLLKEDS